MVCPTCGAGVTEGARFCSECGHEMRAGGDERRVVTVVFGDLVGFTTLSEHRDPETVKILVDRCFERLAGDIVEFGGRVDQIIGDAIVAIFGAPLAHEDDAERAVRAALRMQETMASLSSDVSGAELRMRIGVNTGEVLVGALRAGGSTTAMGDVVNTAARLQTAANAGEVLVGPTTYRATRAAVDYEPRGLLQAKGREGRVEMWSARAVLMPPGHRPRLTSTPLVGRQSEMGILTRALDASVRHRRALWILLVGDAGVGKTRLAAEIGSVGAERHDAIVSEGRCVPYGEANVWWPVAEALRGACLIEASSPVEESHRRVNERVRQALGESASDEDVDRVAHGLLHLMGYEGQLRGIDPSTARDEATRSLVAFIEGSMQFQPSVLQLSDLHWADDVVLEMIDTLLERLARQPFIIVATARPSLLDRWSPKGGLHNAVNLHLDPLGLDATGELLESLLGGEPPPALRQVLLDRSGGNPFFLEELVSLVGQPDEAQGTAVTLPDTLRGLVAARLDGLTPQERTVLDDASVVGPRGPVFALRRIAEEMNQDVDPDRVLASLVAKDLFRLDGGDWAFRSDLVREVAYGTLTKVSRAQRHFGIAKWIEDHLTDSPSDDSVDRMAHHYAAAAALVADFGAVERVAPDVRERALRWLAEAARRAEEAQAVHTAERLTSQGLDLVGDQPSSRRVAFLLCRSRARTESWDLVGARADADAAMAAAAALDDELAEARALVRLGAVEQKEHDPASAETLTEAVKRFAALGERADEAEALRLRGFNELFLGSFEEAERSVSAALDAFREIGDRRGEAWALQNLAWIAFVTGQIDRADERLDVSITTFTELGDAMGKSWACGLLGFVRFMQGRPDEAEALAQAGLDAAAERGDRWASAMMTVLQASLGLWAGRTAEAANAASEAASVFAELGDSFGRVQALAPLARALVMNGRIAEGIDAMGQVREIASRARGTEPLDVADMLELAVAVQLGEPPPAAMTDGDGVGLAVLNRSGPGRRELQVASALSHLQCGRVVAASEQLAAASRVDAQEKMAHYAPSEGAAAALIEAAAGQVAEARTAAESVLGAHQATYADKALAEIGLAFAADTEEARRLVDSARARVDATGDQVFQAVVRLAEARVLEILGDATADAVRRSAQERLERLGIEARGWITAFDLAAWGTASAAVSQSL